MSDYRFKLRTHSFYNTFDLHVKNPKPSPHLNEDDIKVEDFAPIDIDELYKKEVYNMSEEGEEEQQPSETNFSFF